MNHYYNSFFYQNNFTSRNFPNSIIYPRFNKMINRTSSINLPKIIDTTQRGINTINQIVPLYKQITPIIKQVTSFTKSINSFIFKRNSRVNNNSQNISKEPNYQESYREQNIENKPFFNEK